jgi:hypothetical protein
LTNSEFSVFLYGTVILCCVLAIFNVVKNAKRGPVGYLLSGGFLAFAATIYLYKTDAPTLYIKVGVGVLILFLLADFYFRAGTPPAGKKR